jgi:hypothetical protein
MTHEEYFSQLTKAANNNPNWATDLIRQQISQSFKNGVNDGNRCEANKERCHRARLCRWD